VLDRNVADLLQELRVAVTGVQILFAFLLSRAFTQRFQELGGFDLAVYVTALMSTAVTTMLLLIAPVSFHRLLFRRRQKAALVVVALGLPIVGLALLIPAISSSVLLILDVALGRWPAVVGGSLTAAQADRVYGLTNRVLTAVLILAVAGAAIAVAALALHLATFGRGVPTVLIASLLVIVLLVVSFDLDRPTRGLIRVPPTALVDVGSSMTSAPAATEPGHP
jgi:hypothetical protein